MSLNRVAVLLNPNGRLIPSPSPPQSRGRRGPERPSRRVSALERQNEEGPLGSAFGGARAPAG
jgi:hypothetical protein